MTGHPPDLLTVGACQVDVPLARRDFSAVQAAVEEAVTLGARLVVLPELVTFGGVLCSDADARAVAESIDGPTVRRLAALSAAQECVLAAGIAERAADGSIYNAAVLLDHGHLVGHYRKVHLWGREKDAFTEGAEPPLVVATSVGRVGLMVCYDLEFPEWVRLAAEAGAEVLAVPVNWPLRPDGDRLDPFEVVKARAAAVTYRVNVVVADRCGVERSTDWYGASLVCDVDGVLRAGPARTERGTASPAVLVAEVDLAAARDKRLGPDNDAFGDRRAALY